MSEFIAPNSKRAIEQAKSENLDVVFPADNQLQLDIDSEAAFDLYNDHYDIVNTYWGIDDETITLSRSGNPDKRHITLTLSRKVSNKDRIALQAFLGSDLKREVLSFVQAENGDPHPTLFLEKRGPKAVEAWQKAKDDMESGELVADDPEHENHIATFQV